MLFLIFRQNSVKKIKKSIGTGYITLFLFTGSLIRVYWFFVFMTAQDRIIDLKMLIWDEIY